MGETKKTFWEQDEISSVIALLKTAKKVIDEHEFIDKSNPYFVTSESRLSSAVDESLKWAEIINSVGKNVKRENKKQEEGLNV